MCRSARHRGVKSEVMSTHTLPDCVIGKHGKSYPGGHSFPAKSMETGDFRAYVS